MFKPIRLHYLPGRHYDGREHPQPSPRYAAENFLQLAYGTSQVLKQKINPEPAEGNYGDLSKSRGACVFRFHIGLPRAPSLALPTCRTGGRQIDIRCVLLPLIFLPTISGDLPHPALSPPLRAAARTLRSAPHLCMSLLPLAIHRNPLEKRFSPLV